MGRIRSALIAATLVSCTISSGNSVEQVLLGPDFTADVKNVTVPAGRDVTLSCSVVRLGSHKVAWIHYDRSAILTVQNHVITPNPRIGVSHDGHGVWNLHIKDVERSDEGQYMCQINTDPAKMRLGNLHVVVPPRIVDSLSSSDMVQVVHLTHDLNPATHRLIANEFLPDLPDNPYKRGWKEEYYSTTDWIYVEKVLGLGHSLAAVDSSTGDLLGVSIMIDRNMEGKVRGPFLSGSVHHPLPQEKGVWHTAYQWSLGFVSPMIAWIKSTLPSSMLPTSLSSPPLPPSANPAVLTAPHHTEITGYSIEKVMDRLNCSRVMSLEMLSVAKHARRRGIATTLVRDSEEAARRRGCDCVTSRATSAYTARILHKLGWIKMERLRYDDYRDPVTGQKYLVDHAPHTEMAAYEKRLKPHPSN